VSNTSSSMTEQIQGSTTVLRILADLVWSASRVE
jgi:hypothetical protein